MNAVETVEPLPTAIDLKAEYEASGVAEVLDELDHIHRPASCMEEELSANVERGYIDFAKAGP